MSARRARKKTSPLVLFAIFGGVLLLVLVGYFVQGNINDPYRTLTRLDVRAYLDNANSLRGNTYRLEGTVLNSLAWSPDRGRLFSVQTTGEQGDGVVPLLFPPELNSVNLQKGQQFSFRIEVIEDGVLLVKDLKKG